MATAYNDPYNLARRFASLDRISDGRAGWNAVTGFTGDSAFFEVGEALSVPPSPQGHSVVVNAEASEPGIDLGGPYGEPIYLAAPTFDHAVEQTAAHRAKGEACGRDQQGIKVAPGLFGYIGATRQEAEENRQRIFGDQQLLDGLGNLKAEYPGFDFSGYRHWAAGGASHVLSGWSEAGVRRHRHVPRRSELARAAVVPRVLLWG